MKQKIIVTALPNGLSKAPGGAWKISAALGLQVEDANTTLQQVPDMQNWAALIAGARFRVYLNGQALEAKVVSKTPDADLWKKLFTPTVNVKSFVQEDLSTYPIVSYPVKHVLGYIKGVVEQTGKNFANDLPDTNYYTENPILTGISDYAVADFPKKGREKLSLDRLVMEKKTGLRLKELLGRNKAIPFRDTPEPTFDFAQLKNFHGLYDKKPIDKQPAIKPPDFEFHDILSVLSGYPQLQRRLGLVVDLEFTAPANILLRVGTTPTVRLVPDQLDFTLPTQWVCPATAYQKTSNGFYALGEKGSLIDRGHLRINTPAFTVFQVDTDGAALKLCQQVDALQLRKAKHIFYAAEGGMPGAGAIPAFNNEAPRKEGLPSQRTAGIAVARNGMAAALAQRFVRMNTLRTQLPVSLALPDGLKGSNAQWVLSKDPLFAEDVNLGYRMDVQPADKPGQWFSLHKRQNKYAWVDSGGKNIDIPGLEADEGFIQTSASEEKTPEGPQLKVGEAIARWEGWSLSVPRPGSALNDPLLDKKEVYDKSKPGGAQQEAAKYQTPGTSPFRLNVQPGIVPGSLPMLRFGKSYAIRIRTVDLAGNSVDITSLPENPGESIVGNIRYFRYEPVDAPFLVLGHAMKDGESSEVMAIRSNEDQSVQQYETAHAMGKAFPERSTRHVKPPRTTVEMATTHGRLDKGFGNTPAGKMEAQAIYKKIVQDKDPLVQEKNDYSATASLPIEDPTKNGIPVEYLADPLAAGVTFFISANDPNPKSPNPEIFTKRVSFYFDEEVVTDAQASSEANYESWMNPKTFRIQLLEDNLPSVKWNSSERILEVRLQKGVMLKVNYACFWRPDELVKLSGVLDMMGMTSLSGALGQRIARGQHWMFSPWRELTFVHAVQQPLTKLGNQPQVYPFISALEVSREPGENQATLNTRLLVHAPSTGQLDLEAEWTDWTDDGVSVLEANGPFNDDVQRVAMKAKVYHFTTLYSVFEYVFGDLGKQKGNPFRGLPHLFPDTRHRKVNYRAIATTRYREYFFNLIEDRAKKGQPFPLTRVSPDSPVTQQVIIPSSARPLMPDVDYIIPVFEWDRATKGNLTLTGRATGLRVYLKRPWYSSGEGEQLAVILGVNITDNLSSGSTVVSTWGTDPSKVSAPLPEGIQLKYTQIRNIDPQKNLQPILCVPENPKARVSAALFDVQYDKERGLYYADIRLDFGAAYFPFVRLVLARFQRYSVVKDGVDYSLSPFVQADYIQVPPPRASLLQFGSAKNKITVALSGTVAQPITNESIFQTRLDFIAEPIEADATEGAHLTLQAPPIHKYSYILTAADIKNFAFNHSKAIELPAEWAAKPYRVKVLEYELLRTDPAKALPRVNIPTIAQLPPYNERLVFADVYEVNK